MPHTQTNKQTNKQTYLLKTAVDESAEGECVGEGEEVEGEGEGDPGAGTLVQRRIEEDAPAAHSLGLAAQTL